MLKGGTGEAFTELAEVEAKDFLGTQLTAGLGDEYKATSEQKADEAATAFALGFPFGLLGGGSPSSSAGVGAVGGTPTVTSTGGVTNIPSVGTTSDVNQQLNLATQGPTTAPIVNVGTAGTAAQAPPFLATGTDTTAVPTFDPSSATLKAPMTTQEMIIADAAVGSIIENSVDADGNVILRGPVVNQLN